MAAGVRADIYMWTDDKGVTHFGSSPPKGDSEKKKMKTIKTKKAPSAAAPALPTSAPDAPEIAAKAEQAPKSKPSSRVELFTTATCPYCIKARGYLNSRGIIFQDHDIETDPQAFARYNGYGGGGVPIALIDGVAVHGFDVEEYARLLK